MRVSCRHARVVVRLLLTWVDVTGGAGVIRGRQGNGLVKQHLLKGVGLGAGLYVVDALLYRPAFGIDAIRVWAYRVDHRWRRLGRYSKSFGRRRLCQRDARSGHECGDKDKI